MPMTIDFTRNEEERVEFVARQMGLAPTALIRHLVTQYLPETTGKDDAVLKSSSHTDKPNHFYFTASHHEFHEALDSIAQMNRNLPALSDAAFDRENLYEDRF